MSWNLIVLPPDGPGSDTATLGDAAVVRSRLQVALPGVDWSEPCNGVFDGPGFRIDIDLQEAGEVESFMLLVTGEVAPISTVVGLCRSHGWALFDAVSGDYLDLDNPSDHGWKGYLAHIQGRVVPPEDT